MLRLIVAFGLIQLLGRRGLLREQAPHPIVIAPGDLRLRLQHAALGDGGIALRPERVALGDRYPHLTRDLAGARCGGVALSVRLIALKRERCRIDRADRLAAGQRAPFLNGERRQPAADLR